MADFGKVGSVDVEESNFSCHHNDSGKEIGVNHGEVSSWIEHNSKVSSDADTVVDNLFGPDSDLSNTLKRSSLDLTSSSLLCGRTPASPLKGYRIFFLTTFALTALSLGLLLSSEISLKPNIGYDYDARSNKTMIASDSSSVSEFDASTHHRQRRRLLQMPFAPEAQPLTPDQYFSQPQPHGLPVDPQASVEINLFRRAKDVVSESDVPFLLRVPHTSSDVLYDIMTQCYGVVGKHYDSVDELERARRANVVDDRYVSSHDRPASMFKNFGERFHFLSTPHYQEGAALLTRRHKGRVVLMMRHPCDVAESMYLTRPGTRRGDLEGLVRHVESADYYDNWMTRMLANVPAGTDVTEDHFREARMILENKFLIGMTTDMTETVRKRLKLYFGWKELPGKQGCEIELIKRGAMSLPDSALEEGGHEWRIVRARNHYDMKLYARGMAVFGDQKMRVPIHSVVRAAEKEVVERAFGHLRNVSEERDPSDIPFFWHIPKASGTTVKETLSSCYGLIRTEMIKPPSSLEVINKVLNVDLTTPEAVLAAKKMQVANRGLADVFVSQQSLEGSTVFTNKHMGRAFTIMRHPVKLAASLFYYRRIATWEPTYRPDYKDMTLQEYVDMDGYYDNWMVRMLSNAKLGGLNEGHLELAKTILKNKFIVGISDHMDETFRQLEMYYGWSEEKEGCVKFHLHQAPSNKNKYPVPKMGGPVWAALADKNKFDMSLYHYALELFGEQSDKKFREEKTLLE